MREYLWPMLRRSVANLKRVGVIKGDSEPGDDGQYIQLVLGPEDILVVFAGGPEGPTCAVMPSWGPKVSSTSVTRAVRWPEG